MSKCRFAHYIFIFEVIEIVQFWAWICIDSNRLLLANSIIMNDCSVHLLEHAHWCWKSKIGQWPPFRARSIYVKQIMHNQSVNKPWLWHFSNCKFRNGDQKQNNKNMANDTYLYNKYSFLLRFFFLTFWKIFPNIRCVLRALLHL